MKGIEGLKDPDWTYDLFELAKNGSIENSVNAIDLVFDSGWSSSIELCDRDADLLEMHTWIMFWSVKAWIIIRGGTEKRTAILISSESTDFEGLLNTSMTDIFGITVYVNENKEKSNIIVEEMISKFRENEKKVCVKSKIIVNMIEWNSISEMEKLIR